MNLIPGKVNHQPATSLSLFSPEAVQTTGTVAVGDAKLQSDGKADKVEGKVQNAIGGLKDALKK